MATTGSSSSAATPDAARATADILVGVPSDGRVSTDGVERDLTRSLEGYGSAFRWRLVIARPAAGGSPIEGAPGDGGVGAVTYALQPGDALRLPYHGLTARARAMHAIFQEAQAQGARSCVIVDARSAVAADGLDCLLEPLIQDAADLVAPVYRRHPFAGALVHGLVSPMFRALYGARLRSPISPDFGCSRQLIDSVIDDPIWQSERGQIGIDFSLSAAAVTGGFRVAQAFVGPVTDERPTLDLSTTLAQIVGFVFSDMERRAAEWQRIRGSRALPVIGSPHPPPDAPDVDVAALVESFRLASRELQDVWAEVLPPLAILQWRRLAGVPLEAFRVDGALWARTIYDFAMGHRLRVIARDHLLQSLTPLYLAWLASFVLEVRHLGADEAEARIERLATTFETEKPYLVSQWRWPERFKPVKMRR
jgi:hypothetical protein